MWNIMRYLCYRYSKQHFEKFICDPRFYAIFSDEVIFQHLREKGHLASEGRRYNKNP